MNNSHEMAATIVGAVIGGIAGYLFFTERGRRVRRQIEPALEDFSRELMSFWNTIEKAAGQAVRQKVVIRQGIDRELAKRLVKEIKDGKLKVQVTVQGDELRVSGKKRDDLQEVIQYIKGLQIELPLQYVNVRD